MSTPASDTAPQEWFIAWDAGWLYGVDLRFGFASRQEAGMWGLLNLEPKSVVGIFKGNAETVKAYVASLNEAESSSGPRGEK